MLIRSAAVALCFASVMAASPAFCYSVTPLGTLDGSTGNNSRPFEQFNSMGQIDDFYTFTVTKNFSISASITNSFSSMEQYITDFTVALFKGAPPSSAQAASSASGSPIASGTTSDADSPPGSEGADLKALGLLAGTYYLEVSGMTGNTPSYTGSMAVKVGTVPLPASAPLFGAALLGLAGFGYMAKRKKTTAA